MKLQKNRCVSRNRVGFYINELLASIGVPRKQVYFGSNYRWGTRPNGHLFWNRPQSELLSLLEQARDCYREKIKKWHPDKRGCAKKAAWLNAVWARIKTLFARRNIELGR